MVWSAPGDEQLCEERREDKSTGCQSSYERQPRPKQDARDEHRHAQEDEDGAFACEGETEPPEHEQRPERDEQPRREPAVCGGHVLKCDGIRRNSEGSV